jgi:hypothetical protein
MTNRTTSVLEAVTRTDALRAPLSWALRTTHTIYFSLDNIELIKRCVREHRLLCVTDGNGQTLYLNPTAIVTIQKVDK